MSQEGRVSKFLQVSAPSRRRPWLSVRWAARAPAFTDIWRPDKLEVWRALRERYGNRDESKVDHGTLLAPAA
jgi:hypothetical protein